MVHVVFFKFSKQADAGVAKGKLLALLELVPTLRSVEVGVDEQNSQRSWHLCLITRFDNSEGLAAYQVHPAHQEVVSFIKAKATASASVDWSC